MVDCHGTVLRVIRVRIAAKCVLPSVAAILNVFVLSHIYCNCDSFSVLNDRTVYDLRCQPFCFAPKTSVKKLARVPSAFL